MGQNRDLRRDLGASHDRDDRALRAVQRAVQMDKLGLHAAAGDGRQKMCDRFGCRMGAVRRGKRIIDEEVAEGCNSLRKFGIVRFFTRMEAGVLEQKQLAIFQPCNSVLRFPANAIIGEAYWAADCRGQCGNNRLQRHRRLALSLRSAAMRKHDHARALLRQLPQGRCLTVDPQRVGDLAVFHRHVEVGPHEHALARHGDVVERAEFRHQSNAPIVTATSAMRFEKPHSLSYHDITRTKVPSMTLV